MPYKNAIIEFVLKQNFYSVSSTVKVWWYLETTAAKPRCIRKRKGGRIYKYRIVLLIKKLFSLLSSRLAAL